MQPEFWHDRWEHNEIGFHQDSVNQYLREHWSILGLRGGEPVFVPLCGKSLDLHWIHQKGHPVIGVEINALACRQFFEEAGVNPTISQDGTFIRYRHDAITLLCGDFFALTAEHLTNVAAVYDRAALIAFPPETRARYMAHLYRILAPAAQVLLVTMEYTRGGLPRGGLPQGGFPQQEMTDGRPTGPPFSVPESEVRSLCAEYFEVKPIHQHELGRDDPFAKRKGLSSMWEKVYVLSRCG